MLWGSACTDEPCLLACLQEMFGGSNPALTCRNPSCKWIDVVCSYQHSRHADGRSNKFLRAGLMNCCCEDKTGIIVRLSLLDGDIKNKKLLKQLKEIVLGPPRQKRSPK